MEKRIFSESSSSPETAFQPRREFYQAKVEQDIEKHDEAVELSLKKNLTPHRGWLRLLFVAFVLFGSAVVAQSVQWLIDAYNQHQWISLAFSLASLMLCFMAILAIGSEWKKLRSLRKHQKNQQISQKLLAEESSASGQICRDFCQQLILSHQNPNEIASYTQRWHQQLDDAYNGKEVLYLFSQNVLLPLDKQVKKLISKAASENALIVAVSPLAVVDMLLVAWRNIALINKITQTYGMELGYISRLKLFRLVLVNMAFAGASEIVNDIGMDFFSQNLTAKLSIRAAQAIGIGLLTARLGIKAMEFCRPIAFQNGERPKLSVIRQELLGTLKNTLFNKTPDPVFEKETK